MDNIITDFIAKIRGFLSGNEDRKNTVLDLPKTYIYGSCWKIHSRALNMDFPVPDKVLDGEPVTVGRTFFSGKEADKNMPKTAEENSYGDGFTDGQNTTADVSIPSRYLSRGINFEFGRDEDGFFIKEKHCYNRLRESRMGKAQETIRITDGKKIYIGDEILTFKNAK